MKLYLKLLLSFMPLPLPVGVTDFTKWSNDIMDLSGRFADDDSMRFALASMVIHADARHGYLSKRYFVVRLRKVAANQVASQVFQDIKLKQQAEAQAARVQFEKPTDEATPAPEGAASDAKTT